MKDGFKIILFYLVIGLLIFFIFGGGFGLLKSPSTEVAYSELLTYIEDNNISEIVIDQGKSTATAKVITKDNTLKTDYIVANIPLREFDSYLSELKKANPDSTIQVSYKIASDGTWLTVLSILLPILLLGILFYMMYSQQGGGNKAMSFGKSRARLYQDGNRGRVTFRDVAGCDEEKGELEEVVDFLKYPKKYERLGAKIPKGILLVGPPGTGKTLLAKATAGEAGVPFFIITGSDFVEMFVGVGASRVRDLFETAQKNAPCLVFIDEIDAVGRQRGAGLGGGNDEREQTLNQLLVEMDGFNGNEGIIILAATNRADVLDPALLRPGRFDRQIVVNVPDVKAREEILKVHSIGKPIDTQTVNFKTIAKQTVGFTGADLANVLNEAALLTARTNKNVITMTEIEESIKRVIAGPEKRSSVVTEEDKLITAYHEVGHAIVMQNLKHADKVHEISIIPRGMAAGYTISLPEDDRTHVSRNKLYDEITGLLGGRAAETVMLDDICTGAISDIQRATSIAKKMVTEYGMSDTLGPLSLGGSGEDVFIGRDILRSKDVSEEVSAKIDAEVKKIIDKCFKKALDILEKDKAILEKITRVLLEKETISEDEFSSLYTQGA